MTNAMAASAAPEIVSEIGAAFFYHASPARNLASIKALGLQPARSSRRLREDVVHLTSQLGMAVRYAEQGFGTSGTEPWIILTVDAEALDPCRLRPDWDSEDAERCFDALVAHGLSAEQIRLGDYPWSLGVRTFGLAMYAAPIPPAALRIVDGPRLF